MGLDTPPALAGAGERDGRSPPTRGDLRGLCLPCRAGEAFSFCKPSGASKQSQAAPGCGCRDRGQGNRTHRRAHDVYARQRVYAAGHVKDNEMPGAVENLGGLGRHYGQREALSREVRLYDINVLILQQLNMV